MSDSYHNNIFCRPTEWWRAIDEDGEADHDDPYRTAPHYSTLMRAHQQAEAAASSARPTSLTDTHETIASNQHQEEFITQYAYSPRTEPFKFTITGRCIAEKLTVSYVIYSSSEVKAVTQCLINHWFENDIVTDIMCRNVNIYNALSAQYCDDFKVSWVLQPIGSGEYFLSGYIPGNTTPINVSIPLFIETMKKPTSGCGKTCEILWSIHRVALPRRDMTVLSFLRTNVPVADSTL